MKTALRRGFFSPQESGTGVVEMLERRTNTGVFSSMNEVDISAALVREWRGIHPVLQAEQDSIDIAADRDVKITASQGEIVIAARKSLTLPCGGAYIKIAEGKIEHGCGQPCPQAGIWQTQDVNASERYFRMNEAMMDLGSA